MPKVRYGEPRWYVLVYLRIIRLLTRRIKPLAKCMFCGGSSLTMHLGVDKAQWDKFIGSGNVDKADLDMNQLICDDCIKIGEPNAKS